MTETQNSAPIVDEQALRQRSVLVTGAAGFIGYHVAKRLLGAGYQVVGLDNLNPYYEPALKEARLAQLRASKAFKFYRNDIADKRSIADVVDARRGHARARVRIITRPIRIWRSRPQEHSIHAFDYVINIGEVTALLLPRSQVVQNITVQHAVELLHQVFHAAKDRAVVLLTGNSFVAHLQHAVGAIEQQTMFGIAH